MKKYRVTTTSGQFVIEVDYITFEPGHVCFWRRVVIDYIERDPYLVEAIHNPAVEKIMEVES